MKNVGIERLGKTRVRESQEDRKRWTDLKMEGRDRATVGYIENERNPFQNRKAHAHQLALLCRWQWNIPNGLHLKSLTFRLVPLGKVGLIAHRERQVCHCKGLAVNCSDYQDYLLSGLVEQQGKDEERQLFFMH